MHALAYCTDRGRAGDYRVRFLAQECARRHGELGVSVEVTDHVNADVTIIDGRATVRNVYVPSGIQVLLFARPTSIAAVEAIVWLRHRRPDLGLCVDIDEEDADLVPDSPEERNLRRAAAMADVVICSTDSLRSRYVYDPRRTFIVRSAVPLEMLDQPARALSRTRRAAHVELNRDRTIGSGTATPRFMRDASAMYGALNEVLGADVTDGRVVSYRHVGARHASFAQYLNAGVGVPIEMSGALAPHLHRVALGEIDVALVPVVEADGESRSALTALEFAAAGVPVIASCTVEHHELIRRGIPMWQVQSTRRQWRRAVRSILALEDDELKQLAIAHREHVRRYETVETRVVDWAAALRATKEISRIA